MLKIATGFVVGLVLCMLGTMPMLLQGQVSAGVIDRFQQIRLGMPVESVEKIFDDSTCCEIGKGFPPWALDKVPSDYEDNHGLIYSVVSWFRPQVILVFFNENREVTYVASGPT